MHLRESKERRKMEENEYVNGKREMASYNEDFELKTMLKDYLENPSSDKFNKLFARIKNGSKISLASLVDTISDYKTSKNFDFTNDEEQNLAILTQIILERLSAEEVRNYKYDEMIGRLILVEDETHNKVK